MFLAGDLWDSNEAVASLHETKRLIVELELLNSQQKFCWYLTARFLNLSETPHDIVVKILSYVDPSLENVKGIKDVKQEFVEFFQGTGQNLYEISHPR